jgi:hypothetical protein
MSTQTGTAANLAALFTAFVTFVTQTGTGKPGWAVVATAAGDGPAPYAMAGQDVCQSEVFLKAPGLSGTDELFLQLRSFHSLPDDRYNIELRGASGYVSSSPFAAQPIVSPPTYLYVWDQAMPYWFIANAQRAIVVVKVQNTYQSFYLGKILPYGTPGEWPAPIYVGGMGYIEAQRFSEPTRNLSAFWDPIGAQISNPDGTWSEITNWQHNINPEQGDATNNSWPWQYDGGRLDWMSSNLDGSYTTFQGRIECTAPGPNVYGEYDGVCYVTGYENSSESTITIAGSTYLVVPNGFRSGLSDYACILLT